MKKHIQVSRWLMVDAIPNDAVIAAYSPRKLGPSTRATRSPPGGTAIVVARSVAVRAISFPGRDRCSGPVMPLVGWVQLQLQRSLGIHTQVRMHCCCISRIPAALLCA